MKRWKKHFEELLEAKDANKEQNSREEISKEKDERNKIIRCFKKK